MYQVEYYETSDGKQPVIEFLESLDTKMCAKLIGLIDILEEYGPALRMPYSEALKDKQDASQRNTIGKESKKRLDKTIRNEIKRGLS